MKIWKLSTSTILCSILLLLLTNPSVFAQKWSGNNNLDDNLFRNGNVGIGVSNPQTRLHLNGDDNNGSTATLRISSPWQTMLLDGNEIDSDYAGGLFLNNNNPHNVILANGGGNVGIGVSNPNYSLHLHHNDATGFKITREGKSAHMEMRIGNNDYFYMEFGEESKIRGGNHPSSFGGNLSVGASGNTWLENRQLEVTGTTNLTDTLFFQETFKAQSMVDNDSTRYFQLGHIDPNNKSLFISEKGSIVVGTTDPCIRMSRPIALDVMGTTNTDTLSIGADYSISKFIDNDSTRYLQVGHSDTLSKPLFVSNQGIVVGTTDPCMRMSKPIALDVMGTTNTDTLSIGAACSITKYVSDAGKLFLQINDTTNNNPIFFSPKGLIMGFDHTKLDSIVNNSPVEQKLRIKGEATIDCISVDTAFNYGSPFWTHASDERLKKNIEFLPENSLSKLMSIQLYEYEYINKIQGRRYGIKAQEMNKIMPRTVGTFRNNKGEEFLNFNPSDLFYLHIKATQEMNTKIEEQEQSIEDLTEENQQLQDRVSNLESQMNEIYALLAQSNKTDEKQSIVSNVNFMIGQNIPNPSDNETIIPYFIPEKTNNATLYITDISGKVLSEQNIQEKGNGNLRINTSSFPIGTYVYYLKVDNNISDSKKMIIE